MILFAAFRKQRSDPVRKQPYQTIAAAGSNGVWPADAQIGLPGFIFLKIYFMIVTLSPVLIFAAFASSVSICISRVNASFTRIWT